MATWTKEVVDLSVAGDSLQIDDVVIYDNYIGHTDDIDLIKLTSNKVTISGNIQSQDATLTGNVDISAGTTTLGDVTYTGSTSFADNAEIRIGDGYDTIITHNGNDTFITHSGTGTLKLSELHVTDTSLYLGEQNYFFSVGTTVMGCVTNSLGDGVFQLASAGKQTLKIKPISDDSIIEFMNVDAVKWKMGNDATNDKFIVHTGDASLGSGTGAYLELNPTEGLIIQSRKTISGTGHNDVKVPQLVLRNKLNVGDSSNEGEDNHGVYSRTSDIDFYMDWKESFQDKLSARMSVQLVSVGADSSAAKIFTDIVFSCVGIKDSDASAENTIREALRLTGSGDAILGDGDMIIMDSSTGYGGGGGLYFGVKPDYEELYQGGAGFSNSPSHEFYDDGTNTASEYSSLSYRLMPHNATSEIDSGGEDIIGGYNFLLWEQYGPDIQSEGPSGWRTKPALTANQNMQFNGTIDASGDNTEWCVCDANGLYGTEVTTASINPRFDLLGQAIEGVTNDNIKEQVFLVQQPSLLSSIRIAARQTNSDTSSLNISVCLKKPGTADESHIYVRGKASLNYVQNQWVTNTVYTDYVERVYGLPSAGYLNLVYLPPGSLLFLVIGTAHADDVVDFKVSLELTPVHYNAQA